MVLNEAVRALSALPVEYKELKAVDCRLKFYDGRLILAHYEKQPLVFAEGVWRVLEARDWRGRKEERRGEVQNLA